MSSGRGTTPDERFIPRVEGLEDRTVPSGNVQVDVVAGQLRITGDGAANNIWISGTGRDSVDIRSLDGTTTINGKTAAMPVDRIKHGYKIDMGGGDDILFITGTRSNGELTVDMGAGNDVLGVSDAGHRGETTLTGGAGNDLFLLNGSEFHSYVFANTGAGNDTVLTNGIQVRDFGLLNPAGADYYMDIGSAIGRPAVIGFKTGKRPATPDTTAPAATLTTAAPNPTNASIPFVATFSENVGKFTAAGVAVVNGTVNNFTQVDARTYTFIVTPTGQGTVSVTIAAGAAVDASANPNTASNTVSRTFDSAAPVLTVNALTTNSTTPTLTGTVDDPTAAVVVTVNGQTLTATVTGTTWSAAVTTPLTPGTYDVTATGTDPLGNTGSVTRTGALVVNMTTPPTFTATNPPTVNFNAGAQTVTGFATFTPGLNGGTTPTYTVSNISNSGLFAVLPSVAANGTLTYTPVTGGFGSSTFAVSVSDGTNSSATQTFTITVDPVMGVTPAIITGTTIDLSSASWVTIPTVVGAGNLAGIPAGTVADGTRILDVTVGSGATVTRGALVTVAYKGYLLDGTVFDQSLSAQFTADELHLIPGFAAGLIGMKVGGTRDIDISSYLAYGSGTQPGGASNARLVFEVTVNSIP